MKTFKYLLASALCMLVSCACSGSKSNNDNLNNPETAADTAPTINPRGKALVVFFSHAGDNYSVGNIKEGNTKIVADYICEMTGADRFEIVTHKYDGMAYRPLCDLAKQEQLDGELPPFEGAIEDITRYETIFIGGPVWWGTWPQVMFSFFGQYDLNGKTLIPFTTHEGSGLGMCVDDLREAYPDASITGAFSIYGHDVRKGKDKVEKWLKGFGFGK